MCSGEVAICKWPRRTTSLMRALSEPRNDSSPESLLNLKEADIWHPLKHSQTLSQDQVVQSTGPDGVEWIHFDRILRRWTGRQNNRLTKCNCDRLRGLGIEEQDIWPQYHSIPNTIQNPKQKSEPPWIAGHNRMKVLTMNSQSQPGLKNTFVAGNLQKLISKRETNQGPSISPTVDESARVWTYMYITLVCENREPIYIIIIEICCHVSCCQAGLGYVKGMNISRICSLHHYTLYIQEAEGTPSLMYFTAFTTLLTVTCWPGWSTTSQPLRWTGITMQAGHRVW